MSHPIHIIQVLLLFEQESVQDLSPVLWAALHEVERFYNRDQRRATFERHFVSRHQPPNSLVQATFRTFARVFGKELENAMALIGGEERRDYPLETERSIQGRYTETIDQHKLWTVARQALSKDTLSKDTAAARLLIVTDREITPPKDWRYIIWDGTDHDAVVSVAPTDPKYWRQRDPARQSTIKHRVRTACLSLTGEYLGLQRCENPACFLYGNVDSVVVLDTMSELGPEHDLTKLTGVGFEPIVREPAILQIPVERPVQAGHS